MPNEDFNLGSNYQVGDKLILVTWYKAEHPVTVTGHTALDCDLVVEWTGLRTSLDPVNTVCLNDLREIRRA